MRLRWSGSVRRGAMLLVAAVAVGTMLKGCSSGFYSKYMLTTETEAKAVGPDYNGLYLRNGDAYPVGDMAAALYGLGRDRRGRALVLYVHGMGTFPSKAYRWDTLERIETQYPADVVMFHWPAWIDFVTIPRGNANASGDYLGQVLEQLQQAVESDANLAARPRVLLLHSLGAEVLKGFLERYRGGLRPDLLDAVVLAAPEVDLAGHADWLGRVDFARSVYVMQHANDRVLRAVRVHENEARLGMSRIHLDGREEPLAPNATYIDVGAGTRWHRYHVQGQTACLAGIFRRIADGNGPVTETGLVAMISRPNVYAVTSC